MEIKAELLKPYTDEQRMKFIVENNHKKGYTLEFLDNSIIAWDKSEDEKLENRKQQFQNDFFLTSLGYIRRKVTMKNGEIKDFLSDLLPVISIGVSSQQTVNIITYAKPDFMSDMIDWTKLQSVKPATPEFVQECFLRLSDDFNS